MDGLKTLKIESPYDPSIPLLDIYLEKTIIQKDTCTTMFKAALFTIVKPWKQPKCPLTDGWIKMWYSGILLNHKKNAIMPFSVVWMDLKTIILNEVSQKVKYHMISLLCGI